MKFIPENFKWNFKIRVRNEFSLMFSNLETFDLKFRSKQLVREFTQRANNASKRTEGGWVIERDWPLWWLTSLLINKSNKIFIRSFSRTTKAYTQTPGRRSCFRIPPDYDVPIVCIDERHVVASVCLCVCSECPSENFHFWFYAFYLPLFFRHLDSRFSIGCWFFAVSGLGLAFLLSVFLNYLFFNFFRHFWFCQFLPRFSKQLLLIEFSIQKNAITCCGWFRNECKTDRARIRLNLHFPLWHPSFETKWNWLFRCFVTIRIAFMCDVRFGCSKSFSAQINVAENVNCHNVVGSSGWIVWCKIHLFYFSMISPW